MTKRNAPEFTRDLDYYAEEIIQVTVPVRVKWKRGTPGAREHAMARIDLRQKQGGAHVAYGCYSIEALSETEE